VAIGPGLQGEAELATISDVASRAGVSMKTVSRVLNNEPHVRPALREKVEQAAHELNYRPNQAARRLAGGRSFLIAHLYDNPSPNYIAAVHSGAARRCRKLGYHLVIEPVDAHGHDIVRVIQRLVETLAPDGVMLTPPLSDNPVIARELERLGTPVAYIAAASAPEHAKRLFVNERGAAREMTEHLIALGHRDIAIVRGHPEHQAASARFDGYCDALAAAGIRVSSHLIAQGYFDLQSGIDAGRALLGGARRPTAIFATNDEMAIGVMIAARDFGLDVPHDLSVAGFDDAPMSRLFWPPLTTVRQPLEDMGGNAVEALVKRDNMGAIELPCELVVRNSTAAPPTQDAARRA